MKKVLFIHDVFPCGGAEKITIDIADYITSKGYEFHVVACHFTQKLPNIIETTLPDSIDLNSPENARFISQYVAAQQIDLGVLPIRALDHFDKMQEGNVAKWVFSLHSTPLWEEKHLLSLKKRRAKGKPLKMLEWIFLSYPKIVWLKKAEKKYIVSYQRIYNLVDAYTVLCDEYKQILVKKLRLHPTDNKIHTIYNPSYPAKDLNLNKKKQILFVGRLTYIDKRIDRLLDIWGMVYKKALDWELIIVGDGEERESLQSKATKMQLDRISFVGYTNDVDSYYHDASIICLTSSFEGWPLSLAEGQANGVIPFAFDCTAGLKEMLSPSGVNGFLIPSFNRRVYAKTLLGLMKDSERQMEMRPDLVNQASKHSPQVIGEKWLTLFNSLTEREIV